MALDRYRDLIPDWDAFARAASIPEPVTLRVRTGRIAPAELARRLEGRGFRLEPLEAPPDFFRVAEEPFPVSLTLEHWLGLFYLQQAVTGLAAVALAPGPDDTVLDLCAAPGGKATHLADLVEGGMVVAADFNEKRLRALLGNAYRMGHANLLTVAADGRRFPAGVGFDHVMVDVPCSAEGTVRQRERKPRGRPASFNAWIGEIQWSLLRRAVRLTRPGGTVLYVTCTFAPEENEAIVDQALRKLPVRMLPIDLAAPHDPGLTHFGDARYHPDLVHAWRVYPHHLDSGGLFLARLQVLEGEAEPPAPPVPPVVVVDTKALRPAPATDEATARVEAALERFRERFGVSAERLRTLGWMVRGDSVWAHRCRGWPLEEWEEADHWRLLSVGLRAFQYDPRGGERPSNDFLRWLGPDVRRGLVDLSPSDALRILQGEELRPTGVPDGFVALRLGDWVIGRGWVRRGVLRHEIPRAQARDLLRVLETGIGSLRDV